MYPLKVFEWDCVHRCCNVEKHTYRPFFSVWSRLHVLLLPKVGYVTTMLLFCSTLFVVVCEQIDNKSYVEFLHFKILYKTRYVKNCRCKISINSTHSPQSCIWRLITFCVKVHPFFNLYTNWFRNTERIWIYSSKKTFISETRTPY